MDAHAFSALAVAALGVLCLAGVCHRSERAGHERGIYLTFAVVVIGVSAWSLAQVAGLIWPQNQLSQLMLPWTFLVVGPWLVLTYELLAAAAQAMQRSLAVRQLR